MLSEATRRSLDLITTKISVTLHNYDSITLNIAIIFNHAVMIYQIIIIDFNQ